MPKRLVVCCDGTWNTPEQKSGGKPTPTNVVKVHRAIAHKGTDGVEQRAHYQPGVGTKPGEHLTGGAFGAGLSRDVQDAYRFVVLNFEPGDELYFFGFSRGAYTARSTVGLIHNCGILRREHASRIGEAYALYRSRNTGTTPQSPRAKRFRADYSRESRIRFIGVWDTVGALGIPLSGLRLVNVFNRRFQFHDTQLSNGVDTAFQALAIDERRGSFRPTLWKPLPVSGAQLVQQVWFSGVHSDVGGGYPAGGLADLALLWLVERARTNGLTFKPELSVPPPSPNALGELHDSRTGIYRILPVFDRQIGTIDGTHEYVASSAVTRTRQLRAYRPKSLMSYLGQQRQIMRL